MRFTSKSLAAVLLLLSSSFAHAGTVLRREDPIQDAYVVMFKKNVPEGMSLNLKGQQVLSKKQLRGIAEEYGAKVTDAWTALVSGIAVEMPEEAASRLADHPLVDYVETQVMNYMDDSTTWGLDRIDQQELPLDGEFNPQNDGSNVTSYIIDSGVRISHQEFQGRAEWGTNIIDDNDTDCNGHGTHVAGTVAGAVYGVGKATKIVAVKIFACSGGTPSSNTIAAMNWVAEDAATNPDTPATCNMSLGGPYNQASNDAAAALVDSGVVTVVAAGNNFFDACMKSPASEPKVITVASTTNTDARSWFSNYGTCVDIFAPGSDITSAYHTSNTATRTMSGTSMACPHVCGVAGLAMSAGVDPFDVPDELTNGATADVITNAGPNSPNLLVFTGNIVTTVSPSTAPSTAPSAIPSAAPSEAPSAAPSVTPSAIPSAIPSAAPSVVPSVVPTMKPSVSPSISPSASPTIEICEDSLLTVSSAGGGCAEVALDLSYCGLAGVPSHCPLTCGSCSDHECADSELGWDLQGGSYTCPMLEGLPQEDIDLYCGLFPELTSTCRLTCQFCPTASPALSAPTNDALFKPTEQ